MPAFTGNGRAEREVDVGKSRDLRGELHYRQGKASAQWNLHTDACPRESTRRPISLYGSEFLETVFVHSLSIGRKLTLHAHAGHAPQAHTATDIPNLLVWHGPRFASIEKIWRNPCHANNNTAQAS